MSILNARPSRIDAAAVRAAVVADAPAVSSAANVSAYIVSASGCRPSPNSAFMCASDTREPSAIEPSSARPVPVHRPGDSPFSE